MSLASPQARSGAVEAIERIVDREGEADAILRGAVSVLAEHIASVRWAAIAFVEPGGMVVGPRAGDLPAEPSSPAVAVPVVYGDATVAEVWLGGGAPLDASDEAFLGRVAALLSPYCLVGWDTGGEEWAP